MLNCYKGANDCTILYSEWNVLQFIMCLKTNGVPIKKDPRRTSLY